MFQYSEELMDDATSKQNDQADDQVIDDQVTDDSVLNEEVVDGEIVEDGIETVEDSEIELVSPQEIQEQAKEQLNEASELLDLEQTIKTYYQGVQSKREEMKQYKEMISDTFSNDKSLAESEEKMKSLKMESNKIKEQLAGTSAVIEAKQKLKELTAEVRDLDKALSKFLLDYRDIAQTNQIMVREGEMYQIVQSAKLVKQTAVSRD